MEDFTTNNPDSLDGDFKALLAMRKTRQTQIIEQEEKLIEKTLQKFKDNKNKKQADQATFVPQMSVISEDSAVKGDIDYDKNIDEGNIELLKLLIGEVKKKRGNLDQLVQAKTSETPLHRALSKDNVDMHMVTFLVQSVGDKQICTSQQLSVGGKKSLYSVLHMATEKGHVAAAKLIISSIVDKEKRNELLYTTTVIVPEGQRPRPLTCLHVAAKGGNNDLVTYFIKDCGMSVDLANDKGDLPILWAANDNRPHTVHLLIQLGANVNGQNDKGSSALHWACRNGHTEVVRILLTESKGINVNIERRLGLVCPIIAASAMGFTEIVKLLIHHKADINKTMKGGHTALHFAAVEGCLDVVAVLLDSGAKIDALDDQGNNALLLAATHGRHQVVVFLAKCGSNFHQRNLSGKGVWDYALEQKNAKLMMALVDHVATNMSANNAQTTDNGRSTPVWPLLSSSSTASQKLILPPGITPLHAAASIGDNDIIQFLIEMNIDPFGTDDDESTFIHIAAKHNQWETLKMYANEQLCRAQDYRGYTALHIACEHACNEAIGVILPLSNLGQTNRHNQTALHLAARSTDVTPKNAKVLVTQMILHHDWTVVHVQDVNKRSALHSAVLAGNTHIIPELNQLSPNNLDSNGSAPLHIAIMNGDQEMLDQLIATFSVVGRTINLNMRDNSGDTPLHLAAKHSHEKMVETLIISGADLEKPNTGGRTVLHELALLISEKRTDELSYMQVFNAIRDTCIHWWCRQKRKSVPSTQADDNIEFKRKAMLHLFTSVHNEDGLNVLQYAAKLAATEMIIAILNTPNVFRFTTPQSTIVKYDVSDLLPFTSTHEKIADSRKVSKVSNAAVTPNENESHAQVEIDEDKASTASIAELLVKVDAHAAVASVLDASPLKNIVDSYWGAYQKLFAAAFLLHVLVMAVYSYSGIEALGCFYNGTATGSSQRNEIPRSWQSELGLAISLMWPICLLIYDAVKMVKLLMKCFRVGGQRTFESLRSESEYLVGSLILQLCGFLYSILTICWYIMNRYCHPHQDYVLAMSYVCGWVYAIDFTRGFKQVHHFSIILQHILFRDMLRFGLIYLFILLAFSFAYAALVHTVPSLSISGGNSIFLVFNWMIGMDDFETDSDEFEAVNKDESMVRIVYAAYIILSTIVLLNLLIAMMSDSYADVRKMSEVMWKIGSLRLPLKFEEGLGRSYYRPKHLHFDVDTHRWYIEIPKKYLVEREASSDAVIHDLTVKVERLVEESRIRESRVLAILQSKGIDVADNSEK